MADKFTSKIPEGPLAQKWTKRKSEIHLVSPNNKRKLEIIVVGTGLGGASAAASLGELGYYNKWYGSARAIAAPKGTPKEIIDFYQAAFFEAMNDDDYLAAAERAGITTMFMNSSDTANLISEQYEFCANEIAKLWE